MTKIEEINKVYRQKSKLFLFPLLGIRRNTSSDGITAIQTFLQWEGKFTLKDKKLICVYPIWNNEEFANFEKLTLKENRLFESMFILNEHFAAYVFDFSKDIGCSHTHWRVSQGRYSLLKDTQKKIILSWYKKIPTHQKIIRSFLYPDAYYGDYADLFTIPSKKQSKERRQIERMLREVGQLCSKPDLERETLRKDWVDLRIKEKKLTLS